MTTLHPDALLHHFNAEAARKCVHECLQGSPQIPQTPLDQLEFFFCFSFFHFALQVLNLFVEQLNFLFLFERCLSKFFFCFTDFDFGELDVIPRHFELLFCLTNLMIEYFFSSRHNSFQLLVSAFVELSLPLQPVVVLRDEFHLGGLFLQDPTQLTRAGLLSPIQLNTALSLLELLLKPVYLQLRFSLSLLQKTISLLLHLHLHIFHIFQFLVVAPKLFIMSPFLLDLSLFFSNHSRDLLFFFLRNYFQLIMLLLHHLFEIFLFKFIICDELLVFCNFFVRQIQLCRPILTFFFALFLRLSFSHLHSLNNLFEFLLGLPFMFGHS